MGCESILQGRVLLIDDEPDVCRDYTKLLRRAGFEVEAESDSQKALERLLPPGRFDVVLSDVSMPSIGGIELLRAVRERDLDLPVVLMSGAPELEAAIKAVEYGAFRFLTKPVAYDVLADTMQRAVHVHRLATLRREVAETSEDGGMQLGDRASLDARFAKSMGQLWMAFQPIVTWRERTVLGYEALVRSEEPSLATPAALLDAAERVGRHHELGRSVRAAVARAAADAPPESLLFININATELNDNELISDTAPLTHLAPRVVLEVTERSALDQVVGLATRLSRLRERGFRIAIDDLGAGYAGLSSFSRLEPEFVKLDMSLIRDVHLSSRKRSLVRGIAQVSARDLGIQVICEGIECSEERDVLALDGLDLFQGYLFAQPAPGFSRPIW
jgi:EAL domain-containing protein (putative c-di-GMP-specific phosphodiesterase class I)/CheY-like chemotaxis protein